MPQIGLKSILFKAKQCAPLITQLMKVKSFIIPSLSDYFLFYRCVSALSLITVKEIKLTRMLLLMAAGFLCFWIPMWALVLWFRFSPETSSRITAMLAMFFFYLSAAINPIIYAFTNGEFRREFRKLLCCRRERSRIVPKKATAFTTNDLVEREEQEANL